MACAIAAIETAFYAALAPLLPTFRDQLGLSKAQVGLLAAMYAIGLCFAAIPVGLFTSTFGVKTAALAGLLGLAGTSIAFGFVPLYWELLLTRAVQGAAGALCWTAGIAWLIEMTPQTRRSEMIGLFSGASAAGAVLGPALGGAAALIGRAEAFAGVAGFASLVALAAARIPHGSPSVWQPLAEIRRAHASLEMWGGQWLVGLPGLLLSTVGVLAPLRLHRLGVGSVGIAVTYLIAASLGIVTRPAVGRWADRSGRTAAIRLLLAACIAVTVVVPAIGERWVAAACVVLAVWTYGQLWGPTMASMSQEYERAGVAQAVGFSVMNLTVGVAILTGSLVAGEIAQVAGDPTAYAMAIAACLTTIVAISMRRRGSRQVEFGSRTNSGCS